MLLSPLAVQKFFDNNGAPMNGGLVFTYAAGTSDKIVTYKDAGGSEENTNPIELDFRGECRIWIVQGTSYKYVLSPPGDTDPPTNAIQTTDDISIPSSGGSGSAKIAMGNYNLTDGLLAGSQNIDSITTGSPAGHYIIDYTSAGFISPPAINLTLMNSGSGTANGATICGSGFDETTCDVQVFFNGIPADADFSIIAIGL